jgi:hypothetical protein
MELEIESGTVSIWVIGKWSGRNSSCRFFLIKSNRNQQKRIEAMMMMMMMIKLGGILK